MKKGLLFQYNEEKYFFILSENAILFYFQMYFVEIPEIFLKA